MDVKRNQDEQIESLTKKCEELERQVEELHHKLEQTPQQVASSTELPLLLKYTQLFDII